MGFHFQKPLAELRIVGCCSRGKGPCGRHRHIQADVGAAPPAACRRGRGPDAHPGCPQHFIVRLFVLARSRDAIDKRAETADLLDFHGRHRFFCSATAGVTSGRSSTSLKARMHGARLRGGLRSSAPRRSGKTSPHIGARSRAPPGMGATGGPVEPQTRNRRRRNASRLSRRAFRPSWRRRSCSATTRESTMSRTLRASTI